MVREADGPDRGARGFGPGEYVHMCTADGPRPLASLFIWLLAAAGLLTQAAPLPPARTTVLHRVRWGGGALHGQRWRWAAGGLYALGQCITKRCLSYVINN
jgi:hypothetical protein